MVILKKRMRKRECLGWREWMSWDGVREDVTVAFGVSCINVNGRKMIDFCVNLKDGCAFVRT